jgi:two-component system, OmpR family, sensor kinase
MERNRIKFEFLVHDLKVPLAVIEAGILSLLQKQDKYGQLNDKQIKILERALRNTIVTRTLVNDALEIGRSSQGIVNKSTFTPAELVMGTLIEVLDLTDHSTADAIKECKALADLKTCLAEHGLFLEIDEAFWGRDLYLDESKVKQIFRNLLINALKYKKNRVILKIARGEGSLFITVSDDGEGIPSGYHKKIFECYFQMDMKADHCVRGHGLGLAGVQVLLEDMRGELSLESDTGKGASFCVKIPW